MILVKIILLMLLQKKNYIESDQSPDKKNNEHCCPMRLATCGSTVEKQDSTEVKCLLSCYYSCNMEELGENKKTTIAYCK